MAPGPRVRFAPSPTGYLHVGNARTALYNQLIARQSGGTIVLRIEDTDEERHVHDAVEVLQRAMRWLGLEWDEGPYFQSERRSRHVEAAQQLFAAGRAYYCDCTRPDIEARTVGAATPGYDRYCRDRGLGPGEGRALRFRVPADRHVTVVDPVRGDPVFDSNALEDFVVVRSSGVPMFVLANTVDDIDMGITLVIRGEEHLTNAAKNLLIWEALDGPAPPTFAHLPLLVNDRRQKLSKRRDKVAIEDFRADGYLPEAMVNYLALCGWSPGDDREILTVDEMTAAFSLDRVVPSSAFFDLKKLGHVNAEWIRALPLADFIARCQPWLEAGPWPAERFDPAVFAAIAPEIQTRVILLSEVAGYVDFLFVDEPAPVDPMPAGASPILEAAVATLDGIDWSAEAIRQAIAAVSDAAGVKLNKGQAPVRIAITGKKVGPPLFESMSLLGRERSLDRLRKAVGRVRLP